MSIVEALDAVMDERLRDRILAALAGHGHHRYQPVEKVHRRDSAEFSGYAERRYMGCGYQSSHALPSGDQVYVYCEQREGEHMDWLFDLLEEK